MEQDRHNRILNVVSEVLNVKRVAWYQMVNGFQLFSLCFGFQIYSRLHVTHVIHCQTEVFTRQFCLQSVKQNRLFANAFQGSVNPFCGVPTCQSVGFQRHFKERKPPSVLLLSDILCQLRSIQVFCIGAKLYFVQQILTIGDEFIG